MQVVSLAAVLIAAALFVIVLAAWAGLLDRPIGAAQRIARRIVSIIITINQKGARTDSIESLVGKCIKDKYPDASISVSREEPPSSRSDRFAAAQSQIASAKGEAESLRDELQEWLDNLPENLQSGSKADELQSAIDELDIFISGCEDLESSSVDFPGMY